MAINGLYAVALALSKSIESMGGAQKLAQDDIETANLVKAIMDKVKQFNGNMQDIELFLQNYINNNGVGTKDRERMSDGSKFAIADLSTMLGKLKEDDAKIDSEQKAVDEDTKQLNDVSDALSHMPNTAESIFTLGIDWAIFASKYGTVSALNDKLNAATANLANHNKALADAKTEQMGTLTNKTASMDTQASGLSSTAQASVDQMMQIMRDGFMFLAAIDDKSKQL